VTSAPKLVVPEILKLVTFVTAPPIEELPVMVKAIPPPLRVEELVTVVPVKVLVPVPVTVTAPV
jgi:hypothetical protein